MRKASRRLVRNAAAAVLVRAHRQQQTLRPKRVHGTGVTHPSARRPEHHRHNMLAVRGAESEDSLVRCG